MSRQAIELSGPTGTRAARIIFALVFALTACSDVDEPTRPNILLISVDTLRSDHMSIYGYTRATTPEIERYFATAHVYENAYTAAAYTSASIVSLLSGHTPAAHGVRGFFRKLSPAVVILPDHLRPLGYQTAGIVSNTVLTDEALGIASRFDHFDDFVDEREINRSYYERRASRTTDAALRWLAHERDDARPHLLWLHYMDPHGPYAPPSGEARPTFEHEGSLPFEVDAINSYALLPGVQDKLEYIDQYDEEIAYADQEIGRFLAEYERRDLLDDAIVVLTADHGEVIFDARPFFEHTPHIVNPVLRVPLLVRSPDGVAKRIETPTSLVDVVPTLLSHLAAPIPSDLHGVPLDRRRVGDVLLQEAINLDHRAPRWAEGRSPREFGRHLRSAIVGDEKWTFGVDHTGRLVPRDYVDLARDPLEARPHPWPESSADVAESLQQMITSEIRDFDVARRSRAGRALERPKGPPELEPHQMEALRALGYAE